MGFPGDQQQPGGWGAPRPPQSPYGPAGDQASGGPRDDAQYGGDPHDDAPYGSPSQGGPQEGFPYGGGHDDSSYGAPHEGSAFGGSSFGGGPPYEQYGDDSYRDGPSYPDSGDDDFGSGGGKKKLIIAAAVVAGVVVVGGGALALTGGGDSKPKPAASSNGALPPKTSATPTPAPTGKGDRLQSRVTDPRRLTLNEVFKARTFQGSGHKFLMTMRRHELKCSSGVHGTTFRKALMSAGCNQVLRATFTNGTLVGTIGVLNLRTEAAAKAAQRASHPKDAFVVPLPGSGDTAKIGHGLSLTTAEADGHYLIMSWVQYPNGKKITSKYYGAVTSFVRSVTLGSNLRPALNYRSMEGKPS